VPLTILAKITAVKGKEDLLKRELTKLVAPTRAENGCLQYDLHQDNDDPTIFVFYENWETRDLWQMHMKAPHIAAYGQATAGAVAGFELNEMTQIA